MRILWEAQAGRVPDFNLIRTALIPLADHVTLKLRLRESPAPAFQEAAPT
jgi:hypothetical protein